MVSIYSMEYGFPQHMKAPRAGDTFSRYPYCFSRELPKLDPCSYKQALRSGMVRTVPCLCFVVLNPAAQCRNSPTSRRITMTSSVQNGHSGDDPVTACCLPYNGCPVLRRRPVAATRCWPHHPCPTHNYGIIIVLATPPCLTHNYGRHKTGIPVTARQRRVRLPH